MITKSKFSVFLAGDAVQSSFLGYKPMQLKIDILDYADGSLRVTIPGIEKIRHRYCIIDAYIESLDDLMVVAQIKDIIVRNSVNATPLFTLNIDGTAYSRYDRVMYKDQSDGFGAKVYADFVNSIGFHVVTLKDAHSGVITKFLNATNIPQYALAEITIPSHGVESWGIVAPDKGSRNKLRGAVVTCDKVRNPETGKIGGIEVVSVLAGIENYDTLVIIDDICEGGGTFIGVADALKQDEHTKDKPVNLYVTHGLFTKGVAHLLEKFTKIYVYNMKESVYNTFTDEEKSRVVVHTLNEA